jgi:hypothetical protein
MDPRVISYPTRLQEFHQQLCYEDRRVFGEMFELWCQVWDGGFQPQFFSFESVRTQSEDYSLHFHVVSWMNLAEHAALVWHMLCLEDGLEILDREQKEDQGEELENM